MSSTSTLLIIDDCIEDRAVYRRYLLKDPNQSYQILETDSAEAGLNLYRQAPCDAILLDFRLPDMTGLELLDELRQQDVAVPTPVIMLTRFGDEAIAVQALKRGACDYLVKDSLKPDTLQLAVRHAIHQSHLRAMLDKTQERQRSIATLALRIRRSLNLEQILDTTVEEVRHLLQCDRVVVYRFDSRRSGTIVAESVGSAWTVCLGRDIRDSFFQQDRHRETIPLRPLAIANVYEAGLSQCHLDLLEKLEVQASLRVPIVLNGSEGESTEVWGLLVAHHCAATRDWQADEVDLLDALSVQLAIAIQQAELLAQTRIALEKEKELTAFKSRIVATVSHEYRTPLAGILAAASTLKLHGSQLGGQRHTQFLEIIEHRARHMARLVDDMLYVNELGLDRVKFVPLLVDLEQFFSEIIDHHKTLTGDSHCFDLALQGDVEGFSGDRGLLRQIFGNLLSNAIKYSPDGGTISIEVIGQATHITCKAIDTGMGIPSKTVDCLFQPFCRGTNVGTIDGTGLGLAIVKACVDLHGGSIAIDSRPHGGTTVSVTLPKQYSPQS